MNKKLGLKSLILRLIFILIGVMGAALGCALYLRAELGSDPVTAFVEGLGRTLGVTAGMATNILYAVTLVALLIVDRKLIHLGTAIYAFAIGSFIDLFHYLIPFVVGGDPSMLIRIVMILLGTVFIGIGLGLYQSAELGLGPTDGINQTIAKKTGISYRYVRILYDILMTLAGWLLGGTVWFGTLLGAFLVGPIMVPAMEWGKRAIRNMLKN
jgi:uncharacterized membrane protein YczE